MQNASSHFLANYKQNLHIFNHRVINILTHILFLKFVHDLYTTEIKNLKLKV